MCQMTYGLVLQLMLEGKLSMIPIHRYIFIVFLIFYFCRYLCEYIYYTSLSINPLRTLFIHVPELNKPYTANQIAKSLEEVLRLCLLQLENCKCIATTNI